MFSCKNRSSLTGCLAHVIRHLYKQCFTGWRVRERGTTTLRFRGTGQVCVYGLGLKGRSCFNQFSQGFASCSRTSCNATHAGFKGPARHVASPHINLNEAGDVAWSLILRVILRTTLRPLWRENRCERGTPLFDEDVSDSRKDIHLENAFTFLLHVHVSSVMLMSDLAATYAHS